MITLALILLLAGLAYGSHVRSQRRAAQRAREYRATRARCQRDHEAHPSSFHIDPC